MDDKERDQLSLNLETPPAPDANAPEERPTGKKLEWVCHPARKRPKAAVAVAALIILVMIIVYYWTYTIWFPVLSFIILYGSLSAFFMPTRYTLTDDEIIVKTTLQRLHKKWSQYRTYYPDRNGVLLSPFARPTRLENFRGIYIRFSDNRDDVMTFVKEMMEKAKAAREGEA